MRIIIVEDELKTLMGIEHLIKEIGREYEVIGTARNGQEGMDLALREKPDVIMTDIRMTQMSGLDMMKALKEAEFSCKYIVISGHADFDYAREALVLGSVDYLLKPMTKDLLEEVLEKVNRILVEETASIRPSNLPVEELLERVLFGQNEEGKKYAQALQERYSEEQTFCLLLMKGDNRFVQQDLEKIHQKVARILNNTSYFSCMDEAHKEFYILIEKNEEETFFCLEQGMTECRDMISEYIAFAKKEFCCIADIILVKKKLQDMVPWNLTIQKQIIIKEDILAEIVPKKFSYPVERERKIVKMIHSGEMDNMEKEIDEFLQYLQADVYDFVDIREAMICLMVALLYAIRTSSYGLYENINNLNILEWVQNLLFVKHYRQIVINVLKQYERYSQNLKKSEHPTINKVLKIVDAEYKEELTVESLAERMNITPEYLSSLFMKELGVKFTVYYTQKKIEAAKQMLAGKNKKIYEVAVESGYNDVKYFCKVFKKYTGISPSEYSRTLE